MQTSFKRKIFFWAYTVTCHLTTFVLCGKRVTTYQKELIMAWLYWVALLTAFCRYTWKCVTNLDLYICQLYREVNLNQRTRPQELFWCSDNDVHLGNTRLWRATISKTERSLVPTSSPAERVIASCGSMQSQLTEESWDRAARAGYSLSKGWAPHRPCLHWPAPELCGQQGRVLRGFTRSPRQGRELSQLQGPSWQPPGAAGDTDSERWQHSPRSTHGTRPRNYIQDGSKVNAGEKAGLRRWNRLPTTQDWRCLRCRNRVIRHHVSRKKRDISTLLWQCFFFTVGFRPL